MMTSKEICSSKSYRVADQVLFKNKMLNWLKRFNIFCLLDNYGYNLHPHRHDLLVGAGARKEISSEKNDFTAVDRFVTQGKWAFGHISYEQGAAWQGTHPTKRDTAGFPLFSFFIPLHVLVLNKEALTIESPEPDTIYKQILDTDEDFPGVAPIDVKHKLSKEEYIEKIRRLQAHIRRGDCYEINFCQEFFADDIVVDPAGMYRELCAASPNPFNGFYRVGDSYLLCASPERFLYRDGENVYSQPMKGTSARFEDAADDEASKQQLFQSEKDRSENVMVVDLVRNDLSRFCQEGTVEVEELFGIYSFPRVHQMISTVKGRLKPNVYFSHIMMSSFPMGSMTGAPKKRVVELIDQYEPTARGIFSGTLGYIDPSGNFDFNVVIRSVMYNRAAGYLGYQVGSGITFYSEAEKEWEECMLKGAAIKKVLTGSQHS